MRRVDPQRTCPSARALKLDKSRQRKFPFNLNTHTAQSKTFSIFGNFVEIISSYNEVTILNFKGIKYTIVLKSKNSEINQENIRKQSFLASSRFSQFSHSLAALGSCNQHPRATPRIRDIPRLLELNFTGTSRGTLVFEA